jgi:hypothetical protein
MPIPVRAIRSCGKLLVKAQATVAKLQRRAMMPMVFLRLHRSTRMEAGMVSVTIAPKTTETSIPHWVSVNPHSFWIKGKRDVTMTRSI